MSNISATVKSIQDIMRQDAGIDGDAQRIGQLTWLLFLKIFDDREYETELLDAGYRSPIPETLRWRTWATPREGITGDDLLDFVNNQLFRSNCQYLWIGVFQATSVPVGVAGLSAGSGGVMSTGRSSSLPLWNTAPARTRATRCGAFTARQRACAASMSL